MTVATKKHNVGGILLDRPFKIRRLGHFAWYVRKMDETRAFYADLLGFRMTEGVGNRGTFFRYNSDHHSFAIFPIEMAAVSGPGGGPFRPDQTMNQITWQTQSLSEPQLAADFFKESGVEVQRFGRDATGSNWATYMYDPDGNRNEVYYGIEQIGWDGHAKPAEFRRGYQGKVPLPFKPEADEVSEAREQSGLSIETGYRYVDPLPGKHDVDGLLLPRPFKIIRHSPVNIFANDVAQSMAFYTDVMGFEFTEEVVWEGHRCVFLRNNTEHHALALFPIELRERLGLSTHTNNMSFGLQVANYRQLKDAVSFLREAGVRVETNLIPRELQPGIDYSAHAFDPEGHCLQLYYSMEQIGWDGKPRPASSRRQVDPNNWPDLLEPTSDTFRGEPFLGPWA